MTKVEAGLTPERLPFPAIKKLGRETLNDRVYAGLRELILDGGIVPGTTITVQSIADAFGVSPMPVREALKRLTEADALSVISGRSVGVPQLDRARLADLRNVRVEIEGLAASWAVQRGDPALYPALAQQLDALESSIAGGDLRAYVRGNRSFHFTIYRAAGSPVLMRIIEDLWLLISPYLQQLEGTYVTANLHHRSMLKAVENQDPAAMSAAIQADINAAYQVLDERLARD